MYIQISSDDLQLELGLNNPFELDIAVRDNVDDHATNKYILSMFCQLFSALCFVRNECQHFGQCFTAHLSIMVDAASYV